MSKEATTLAKMSEADYEARGVKFANIAGQLRHGGTAEFTVAGHGFVYDMVARGESLVGRVSIDGRAVELGEFRGNEVAAVEAMASHLTASLKNPLSIGAGPRKRSTGGNPPPTSPNPTKRGEPLGGPPRDPTIAAPGSQLKAKTTTANTQAPMGLQSKFDPPVLRQRRIEARDARQAENERLAEALEDARLRIAQLSDRYDEALERIQTLERASERPAPPAGAVEATAVQGEPTIEEAEEPVAVLDDADGEDSQDEQAPAVDPIGVGDLVTFPGEFDQPSRVVEIAPLRPPGADREFPYAIIDGQEGHYPLAKLVRVDDADVDAD